MEPKDPTAPSRLTFRRAFRPFWITLVLGAVLLAWDYDHRHAPETFAKAVVFVDGEQPQGGFSLVVDGIRQKPNSPIRVGWRTVAFSAQDGDSIETNLFVQYGVNELGAINLPRSRGKVRLNVSPPPVRYTLRQRNVGYACPTGFFSNIPAGEYLAGFEYPGGLSESIEVRVIGNQVVTNAVTNAIGSIELTAEPSGGEFTMEAVSGQGRWVGTFPFSVPRLRSGEYRLAAKRRDYNIDRRLVLMPGQTNRVFLEFVYGGIEVTTEPAGATVFLGGVERGTTPLKLKDVIPDRYEVGIRKNGFDPLTLVVSVEGTNIAQKHGVLVNSRYRVAMEEATDARQAGRYRSALRALETALQVQPNDAKALALLSKTKSAAFREEATELIGQEFLGEEYLNRAAEALNQADKIEPDSPLSKPLREKIVSAWEERERQRKEADRRKLEEERRRVQENARAAIDDAKSAIRSENLDRARAALAEAKKWGPEMAEIPAVEAELLATQAKIEARVAEQRLAEQIGQRRRQLEEAFDSILRSDKYRSVATVVWQTGASAFDVQRACEPVEDKGLKVFEVVPRNDYLVTWRNGKLIPFLDIGTYFRFAACTLAPGKTEIRVAFYNLGLGQSGHSEPVDNPATNRQKLEALGKSLSAALKGDLKNPDPK